MESRSVKQLGQLHAKQINPEIYDNRKLEREGIVL